ncbi:hypothetical protein R5W23_002866 [Gemmata sp. JC673]|uniref:Uncharacterized protein n=1 Tax=Gemmata algarum TaxID=2975278 RepID=A0ABU5F1X8_9BACT|nr:hypothetical protein [Gemmata algarum]MDY3561588.1 hypothetical protein [Gemmata algarum]
MAIPMRLLAFFSALSIMASPAGRAAANESGDLKGALIDRAGGWRDLKDAGPAHLVYAATDTFKGKVIRRQDIVYRRGAGARVVVEAEKTMPAASGARKVYGMNPDYSFVVARGGSGKAWSLQGLGKTADGEMQRVLADQYVYVIEPWRVFLDVGLPEAIAAAGTEIVSVVDDAPSQGLTKVTLTTPAVEAAGPGVRNTYSVVFDRNNRWMIREIASRPDTGPGKPRLKNVTTFEYTRPAGYAIPVVSLFKSESRSDDGKFFDLLTYELVEARPADGIGEAPFRLSHYNLPEPSPPPPSPSSGGGRLGAWVYFLAGSLGIGAVGLFFLRRK